MWKEFQTPGAAGESHQDTPAREKLYAKDQEIAAKNQELAERDKIIEVYSSNNVNLNYYQI